MGAQDDLEGGKGQLPRLARRPVYKSRASVSRWRVQWSEDRKILHRCLDDLLALRRRFPRSVIIVELS